MERLETLTVEEQRTSHEIMIVAAEHMTATRVHLVLMKVVPVVWEEVHPYPHRGAHPHSGPAAHPH
jgi:hypothetical protein